MKIKCLSCNRLWNQDVVKDSIRQTNLRPSEQEGWYNLPQSVQLGRRFRREFERIGWQFLNNLDEVIRCPNCSNH